MEAEGSLEASQEACVCALEEAWAAHQRHKATEKHGRELQTSNATLERQVQECRAALAALPGGTFTNAIGARAHEEALALEVLEHSLERKRLEVMECQVVVAEDALGAREATARKKAHERVARVRMALADDYRQKLECQKARFRARHDELMVRLIASRGASRGRAS